MHTASLGKWVEGRYRKSCSTALSLAVLTIGLNYGCHVCWCISLGLPGSRSKFPCHTAKIIPVTRFGVDQMEGAMLESGSDLKHRRESLYADGLAGRLIQVTAFP
jgi:hypothetical protein